MSSLVMTLGLCGGTFQYLAKTTVSLCFPPQKAHEFFVYFFKLCVSLKPLHLTLPQNLANFFSVSLAWDLSPILASKFVISGTHAIQNLCRVLCLPTPMFCSAKPWYFTFPVPAGSVDASRREMALCPIGSTPTPSVHLNCPAFCPSPWLPRHCGTVGNSDLPPPHPLPGPLAFHLIGIL